MENNFTKIAGEQLRNRARHKLKYMNAIEKGECVKKEKRRTWCWFGISLYCSLAWILGIIMTTLYSTENSSASPIGVLTISAIVALTISIKMFIRLLKNEEELALIRIEREEKKELKINAERIKKQEAAGNNFIISRTITILTENKKNELLIDDKHKQFIFLSKNHQSKKYHFSDILNYEVYENGHSKVTGRAGSAIIGGALFGVLGLVAGSSMSRNINEKCNQLKLLIRLKDIELPQIVLTYIESVSLDKSGEPYRNKVANLQNVCSILEYMLNEQETSICSGQMKPEKRENTEANSYKQQLEELKELFDAGLITEEDFEQKKKQILGI